MAARSTFLLTLLALACSGVGTARAQVLTITEDVPMEFGTLQIPNPNQTRNYRIRGQNGNISGNGILLYGASVRGEYTIRRDSSPTSSSISIDIASIATSDPAVTLDTFSGKYGNKNIASFPVGALAIPNLANGTKLYIGARVVYTGAANLGNLSASFDIVVNYE